MTARFKSTATRSGTKCSLATGDQQITNRRSRRQAAWTPWHRRSDTRYYHHHRVVAVAHRTHNDLNIVHMTYRTALHVRLKPTCDTAKYEALTSLNWGSYTAYVISLSPGCRSLLAAIFLVRMRPYSPLVKTPIKRIVSSFTFVLNGGRALACDPGAFKRSIIVSI